MPSTTISQRRSRAGTLCSAIAAFTHRIAEALGERLCPGVEVALTTSFVKCSLTVVSEQVTRRFERLRLYDDALFVAQQSLAQIRQRRDKAAAALGQRLLRLRDLSSSLGWPSPLDKGGLRRQPQAMLSQATHALWLLRQVPRELPAGCPFEVDFDFLTADLTGAAEALQTALDELDHQQSKASLAASDRRGALTLFDTTYAAGLRFAEGLFALAGYQRHAGRLKGRGR